MTSMATSRQGWAEPIQHGPRRCNGRNGRQDDRRDGRRDGRLDARLDARQNSRWDNCLDGLGDGRQNGFGRSGGFTLLEVAAAIVILGILFTGIMVAYRRTMEYSARSFFRERAAAVAQRQIEHLLATRQEPNAIDLHGRDEYDPSFVWEMKLTRTLLPGGTTDELQHYVIKAQVRVQARAEQGPSYIVEEDPSLDRDDESVHPDDDTGSPGDKQENEIFELVRFFSWLKPRSGEAIAVPLRPDKIEEPLWWIELRQQLGREPTPEEIQDYVLKNLLPELSGDMGGAMDELDEEYDDWDDEDTQPGDLQ